MGLSFAHQIEETSPITFGQPIGWETTLSRPGEGIKNVDPGLSVKPLSKMVGVKDRYVKKIRNGTVIDHISAGHALDVLKILRISGGEGDIVSVAMNVPSKTDSKKDIVKVENRELKPGEVDKIALIAPGATINIIRDYEVAE